ncbi:mannose-6-phosphate isomerase, class I [Camelliibacillus cellulosilyticus]|uniref:Mannose-6-phosphate isomerase n=1 Tax=Camelliibacillus cellulosilyticus TaxID=2174486 RepID=A0ABV9GNU0_9BACL
MYQEPLFLQPVFKERIWGGERLKKVFGYEIPSNKTGECWGISAHPHGPSIIKNGPLSGRRLDDVWRQHRSVFGDFPAGEFPLLTKILDARSDLSVQVHPDDDYARKVEKVPYGKTECWYVIDCEEGAEIIYGHHAKNAGEFRHLVDMGEWEKLLRKVKVKPGDFFYVPSGTIHAIGGGIMILETQQSSDITYRVYDYDRKDADGKTRELHIDAAVDVTRFPHHVEPLSYEVEQDQEAVRTQLVSEANFTVSHWDVRGKLIYKKDQQPFLLISVIRGEGTITTDGQQNPIQQGDHLIIPKGVENIEIDGRCSCIVSHP